ncbi:MAG: hypothetical protein KBA61_08895 [Spirochaetes bacterium]|nr:hypothetical protein [Spirochaetota bacterium]
MSREYKSGMFCKDIGCPKHAALEGLDGDAYIERKKVHCKDCYAWQFFTWMKDNKWRIVHTMPEISNKQLAAMIKGIDPVKVEDLTEDEILCL